MECLGAGGTPPVSLAEITLRGWGDLDYYDISLVDGFNTLVSVGPTLNKFVATRQMREKIKVFFFAREDLFAYIIRVVYAIKRKNGLQCLR